MERNPALTIFRILNHSKVASMSDAELRKASGLTQSEIDDATDQLQEEGMITVERKYTLAE